MHWSMHAKAFTLTVRRDVVEEQVAAGEEKLEDWCLSFDLRDIAASTLHPCVYTLRPSHHSVTQAIRSTRGCFGDPSK